MSSSSLRTASRILTLCAAILVPLGAPAHALFCTTTVSEVSVGTGGTVTVAFAGMGQTYMCNVNGAMQTSVGPISTAVCNAWVSQFITAKVTGRTITMIFDYPAGTEPASCQGLANFSWQVPSVFPYWISFT